MFSLLTDESIANKQDKTISLCVKEIAKPLLRKPRITAVLICSGFELRFNLSAFKKVLTPKIL